MSEQQETEDFRKLLGQGAEQISMPKPKSSKSKRNQPHKEIAVDESQEETIVESPTTIHLAHDRADEDSEDTYSSALREVLDARFGSNDKKFFELFIHRYGIQPQMKHDKKLQKLLQKPSLSDDEFMLYTQRHFNEYGGFLID